ncbi:afadin isoform X5 [Leucoraja erinacea]|uniref:afadin isoform X5 n=1 Tax=Leucoraja erinaceus TaxID=7782 RepID=UPI002457E33E|nr:afadin isoform X5 [Leucoraja erinacea]
MSSREEERRKLAEIINHWNANRLDLFEISQPTEDLEFHGVMRFYFQDKVAGNFATKCIRVSSTATTQDVIETLAEKFRPDMRMLSSPRYSLYEVHVSGEERKLDKEEKPLVVQLNWNKDDREGRFVLKNENAFLPPKKSQSNGPEKEKEGVIQNFKRTLSKKEKREKKRREKEALMQAADDERPDLTGDGENSSSHIAAEVYKDMPETSFTRTISNPEVVMKRRRQQKLEQRMQEFRSGDGRPDSGGTLRIYADSLKPNIPYKTILLSTTDTSDFAVGEALEKYGLEKENPKEYCIARVVLPPGVQHSDDKGVKETLLDDDECPLQIFRDWPGDKGTLVFQLKKRPLDYIPKNARKQKEQDGRSSKGKERNDSSSYGSSLPPEKMPYLVELSPDGSDSRDKPKLYRLQLNVTDVGTEKSDENSIQLFGPGIQSHHCDLTNMDGIVTVTPRSFDAETYVDGQHITETVMLQSGMNIQFGSSHVFKFVDPSQNHMTKRPMEAGPMVKGQKIKSGQGSRSVQETTFDIDGDIHSGISLPISKSSDRLDSDSTFGDRNVVKPIIKVEQQDSYKQEMRAQDVQGQEMTLPATVEFRESSEDAFLSAVVNYTNSSTIHFKLSPTYVLYMTCRYVISSHYRPDMSPSERAHKVIAIVNKMVSMMEGVIQKQKNIAGALAFWMANASELLNFIKQDRDLSRITLDAQDVLAHLVQMAFKYLVHCLQSDLNNYMPSFLEDPEEANPQRPKIDDVLHTLTGAMSLLRRCRVNAALTIQLFSQLFHFINMWLFNKLVTEPDSCLCSHYWGAIIRQQLGHIEAWAEKQGLELAADCHLSRIVQATTLLTMDKYLAEDVSTINNTCFKLNSLQLQALLQSYHCAQDEPYIPQELIENVVALAENTADELARSDGREVQLEEDPDLQLPFLLPEDGYSCDVVRNIPNGLQEFLEPLCQRGFCRLTPHSRSPGTWTIYFESADFDCLFPSDTIELAEPNRIEPEIITVTLKKQNGMGLSIVAAKGAGQDKLGIYVKSVVKGGAADIDGRLAAGDQLLSVDGRSLVGLSQERAAELMTRTGSVVTLEIARQGAIYHGLATLLNQPSPMMQRASDRRGSGKPRPKSEGFELYNNNPQNGTPESSPIGWTEYNEPKKTTGDDRLLKNRADHRSSPNVANQPPSPGAKPIYSTAPTSKIQSVSTGNLCAEEQLLPTRPEAYPIPTQTYTREYFTFPTSRSQDRVSPVPGPWHHYDEKAMVQEQPFTGSAQRGTRSQEELHEEKAFHQEKIRQEDLSRREAEYRKDLDRKLDARVNQGFSVDSSTSNQEHLSYSSKSLPASAVAPHKSGPGRWKTPAPNLTTPIAVSQPIRIENQLPPPPPPPPPVHYTIDFGNTHTDLPLPPPPPPPPTSQISSQGSAVDRRKREEQQRWYEKEKARLEEERDRKRREQDRKIGQIRGPPPLHINPPQPVHVSSAIQQTRPEKMASLTRPQDTVIRELQPQQQPRTIERRDLQYITISKEQLPVSDSLSPDPWKRDAKEKMEKQQQQHLLEMLSKEIQELQNKPDRTSEENDRLRKLMLEWQFQKRLQESKEKDDDDEEEEDDDVDTTLIMQRLEVERQARTVPAISVLDLLQDEERRRHQQLEEIRKREAEERARQDDERLHQEEERAKRETNEKRRQEEEYYTRLEAERRRQQEEAERKLLQPDEPGFTTYGGSSASNTGANDIYKGPREKRVEQNKGILSQGPEVPAVKGSPENLTFKERQRLFSHGQDISHKVKASRKLMELENELNTK